MMTTRTLVLLVAKVFGTYLIFIGLAELLPIAGILFDANIGRTLFSEIGNFFVGSARTIENLIYQRKVESALALTISIAILPQVMNLGIGLALLKADEGLYKLTIRENELFGSDFEKHFTGLSRLTGLLIALYALPAFTMMVVGAVVLSVSSDRLPTNVTKTLIVVISIPAFLICAGLYLLFAGKFIRSIGLAAERGRLWTKYKQKQRREDQLSRKHDSEDRQQNDELERFEGIVPPADDSSQADIEPFVRDDKAPAEFHRDEGQMN
ncbi:MAG: hypothetical protein NUW37_13095 [Planctomycetes bacterium]|nr:hypothetical protein [Planctomycetota bacterium]